MNGWDIVLYLWFILWWLLREAWGGGCKVLNAWHRLSAPYIAVDMNVTLSSPGVPTNKAKSNSVGWSLMGEKHLCVGQGGSNLG